MRVSWQSTGPLAPRPAAGVLPELGEAGCEQLPRLRPLLRGPVADRLQGLGFSGF